MEAVEDRTPKRLLSPNEKRTLRVANIPKSLTSHHPSAVQKCKAEGQCRMCERREVVRQLTQHHVVPIEWWTHVALPYRHVRNSRANVVPLCRPCHDDVESRVDSVRLPARSMLRRTMSQQEVAFVIAVVGQPWLDARYPLVWVKAM